MSIHTTDFDFIRDLVHKRSAIVLEGNKEYLVEARLTPVARAEGFGSIEKLIAWLRANQFGAVHGKVIEAMTTNETSFFRDIHPFEALRNMILPDLLGKRITDHKLNIWCCACSTGQEPYSMTMLM